MTRHVIVGNGGAAISAVRAIRSCAPDAEILLIDKDNNLACSPLLIPYCVVGRIPYSCPAHGGRSIVLLPSTSRAGTVSRIVAGIEPGTVVNAPDAFAVYFVTEYGVATLLGKDSSERASELIAIAHHIPVKTLKWSAQKLGLV